MSDADAGSPRYEDLLRRFSEGQQEAAETLVILLTPVLKGWVRGELDRLRAPRDGWWDSPSDIVSEIWYQLFKQRYELRPWESIRHLRKFLYGVMKNVAREQARRHLYAQKRDVRREVPLDESLPDDEALMEFITPLDVVIKLELCERLIECVPAGRQAIVDMLLAGHGCEAIAKLTGISLTTVRRLQKRVRRKAREASS